MRHRTVSRVIPSIETLEGGGFTVRRPFPTPELDHVDPFLLLDEMGPQDVGPGEAKGAPDHPHRGFETVTYMLSGFSRDGEGIVLEASAEEPLRVLLIGGTPLSEPIARYGPFVMNTRAELIEAVEDYQGGRLG